MAWQVLFTTQARTDAKNIANAGLREKANALLDVLASNPLQTPPPFEELVGDLDGAYSRRINIQHRLVY
jgi:Txe/YoeB family toxin of toxin-antitoxin system